MQASVYIETSVLSYYTSRASRDVVIAGHQQATVDFWNLLGRSLQPYVSALVIQEAGGGDPVAAQARLDAIGQYPIIPVTSEAEALAHAITESKAVPEQYPEDALHIALATVGGVDFIATWNFSHINNPYTRHRIREVVASSGYVCPEIVSPDELLGDMA